MQATPIDELRKPHPDQKRIDAEAVRLLLATSPAGYAKKSGKPDAQGPIPPEPASMDLLFPRR
jgi:hypothetical protein